MATMENTAQTHRRTTGANSLEKALQRAYTINWEVLVYSVVFVVAVLTRFWDVGARVMSHDESLHTYYSWLLYDRGDFDHTPLMHGPVLFHMVAFFYFLFGPSDFSARIYTALLGIAIVMFPLLFRRWLGKWGAIFASIGLLISPMMMYYSRYIREDIPSIFFMLVVVYGFMQYLDNDKPRRPVWATVMSAGLLLMLASKEVAFMYIAIFGSFLTFYWMMRLVQDIGFREFDEIAAQNALLPDVISPFHRLAGYLGSSILAVFWGLFAAFVATLVAEVFFWDLFIARLLPDTSFEMPFLPVISFGVATLVAGIIFAVLGVPHKIARRLGETPFWQLTIGHGSALAAAAILGYFGGSMMGTLQQSTLPNPPTRVYELGLIAAFFLALQSIGVIRTQLAGAPRPGIGQMIVNGLAAPRSFMLLAVAGTVLGSVAALWAFNVFDFTRPDQIWAAQNLCEQLEAAGEPTGDCRLYGFYKLGWKADALAIDQQDDLLTTALLWMLVPVFVVVFLILIVVALKVPRFMALPWQDVFTLLLIALLVFTVLMAMERRSLEGHDRETGQPVAITPGEEGLGDGNGIQTFWIFVVWLVGGAITALVVVTRLMTNWWDYLNRQPVFDILIVMGTLSLPWLAAFPLFWMGHNLDVLPYKDRTFVDGVAVTIPFLMVSVAVGMSWNWKVWPVVAAVFTALFMTFFTTFFTNGNGVGSGLVGSLGYWLEQQGVRRGSQPQYYYTLLQVPYYEFLPLFLSSVAAFVGLAWIIGFRSESLAAKTKRKITAQNMDQTEIELPASLFPTPGSLDETPAFAKFTDHNPIPEDNSTIPDWQQPSFEPGENGDYPEWARPYDHEEELAYRRANLEYIGAVPFLQLLTYWALTIIIALTMAGEKMPWLTTHIAVPLTLIGGWYVGYVVEQVNWSALRRSGILLAVIVAPVFFIALMRLFLPVLNGESLPLQGSDLAPRDELESSGRWLAALVVLGISAYFLWKLGLQVGAAQTRRLLFLSGSFLIALITLRSAWLFNFINYDYPTEFGVYAHSGPAVKTVLDTAYYFAERNPEGMDIRIVYDTDSSWPMSWYLRDFRNALLIDSRATVSSANLEGAKMVIVGIAKDAEVNNILGDDYYRFEYIRLWWPMQEYFNLSKERITNVFEDTSVFPASNLYRQAMWDIWWSRDYERYGQAMCVEEAYKRCMTEAGTDEEARQGCEANVPITISNCSVQQSPTQKQRFAVENWPVASELFLYVEKEFAAQIWDSGLDGLSVTDRLIPDPENMPGVVRDIQGLNSFGTLILASPHGLKTDAAGNVYVADTGNNRVVVFDAEGQQIRTVGREGELTDPWGVAVDAAGYVYVTDFWGQHSIVVYDAEGRLVRRFGRFGKTADGDTTAEAFYGPRDVFVDKQNRIYVADTGNHRVRVYDQNWTHLLDIGGQGSQQGQLLEPVGVVVHPLTGEIYVAETWNQRISVFYRDGAFKTSWNVNMWNGTQQSAGRPYLAFSPDGTLLMVSDMDEQFQNNGPRVVGYDLSGKAVISFNGQVYDATTGQTTEVMEVSGLAFGPDGRLYVTDAELGRIAVFPPLDVSGSVIPVPDPEYVGTTDADAELATPEPDEENVFGAEVSAEQAVAEVGKLYWSALATGDFTQYLALHCPEMSALLPTTEQQFYDTIAGAYLNADTASQVLVIPEILTATQARLRWEGNVILDPGTSSQRLQPAALNSPLTLRLFEDGWKICQTAEVFRPGGG